MPKMPDTCHALVMPRVLYGPATCRPWCCHVTVRTLPCPLYGLTRVCTDCTDRYSQHPKFCLFGSADRMRYLLHTDSVCDKNYTTGIRKMSRTSWCWFRRIPSTFIFEHFSCPDRLLNPISDQAWASVSSFEKLVRIMRKWKNH
jgi:hypothetical protein